MGVLDRFKLEGKTALVTGCKRGIGKAMAIALAEAGADLVGVSQSMESSGSDVEKEILHRGRQFRGYACDFSDRTALYAFIRQVKADCPVIDILVNNAGIILRKPAAEHPDEYWDKVSDNTEALQADPVRNTAILARIPAGRWGDPVDLMGAVVFLASAASNYVNGAILTVDGGWMGR